MKKMFIQFHRRILLLFLCASLIVNVTSGPLPGVIDIEPTNKNSRTDTTTSHTTVANSGPVSKVKEASTDNGTDHSSNTTSNKAQEQKPNAKNVESGMVEVGNGKQKIDVHININNNINTRVETKKEVTPEFQTSTGAPATTKLPPALKKKAVDLLKELCEITYVHVYIIK